MSRVQWHLFQCELLNPTAQPLCAACSFRFFNSEMGSSGSWLLGLGLSFLSIPILMRIDNEGGAGPSLEAFLYLSHLGF